jgi:hypothetical protein
LVPKVDHAIGGHLTPGADLIIVAGVGSSRSAGIVLQDRIKDQRPRSLRASVSTPIVHEPEHEETVPNVLTERSGQNSRDPSITVRQPGFRDQGEHEGRGAVTEQPPAPTENPLDGDRVCEEEHDIVELEIPGGERCATGNILVRIDPP